MADEIHALSVKDDDTDGGHRLALSDIRLLLELHSIGRTQVEIADTLGCHQSTELRPSTGSGKGDGVTVIVAMPGADTIAMHRAVTTTRERVGLQSPAP